MSGVMWPHYKILGPLVTLVRIDGVGTNFGVGVGEARPEGSRAGDGVLEEGKLAPPHQLGVCGSAVSSLSGVRGGAPAAEWFFFVF